MNRPEISIVTTVYRDSELIPNFLNEIGAAMETVLGPDWEEATEIILVHDGGGQEEWMKIREFVRTSRCARALDLSRNFGQHIAILCGYRNTQGDLVIRLNLDCQDPPSEIPVLREMLFSLEYDMIVGIQADRRSSLIDKFTGYIFFKVFNFLSRSAIPAKTSSLRIMRRRFVDAICLMGDKDPFLQGLESLCGFYVGYHVVDHRERWKGQSSYTFLRRFFLAVDAAITYSDRPLRLAVGFGISTCLIGFSAVFVQIILYFLNIEFLSGYLSIITLIVFFFGIQTTLTAIVGVYVGKTLQQAQNRPLYIIRTTTDKTYET